MAPPLKWTLEFAVIVALATCAAACTDRKAGVSNAPLPIVNTSPVPQPDENIEGLVIHIQNSRFEHDVYQQQPEAIRLVLETRDGPYLFHIDGLVDRRELPDAGTTVVLVNVTAPRPVYDARCSQHAQ